MKRFLKNKNIRKSGFTLVESLIAISIFSIATVTLMTILSNNITGIQFAKKKAISAFLAEEGIEYIRNMRDTYLLYEDGGQDGWTDFKTLLDSCDNDTSYGCYFTTENVLYNDDDKPIKNTVIHICPISLCPDSMLQYDDMTGKYIHDLSKPDSGYKRKITIKNMDNDEIKIISTVSFVQNGKTYKISFSEHLFNWVN